MKQLFSIEDLIGEATEYDKTLELEVKKPKSWLKSVSAPEKLWIPLIIIRETRPI